MAKKPVVIQCRHCNGTGKLVTTSYEETSESNGGWDIDSAYSPPDPNEEITVSTPCKNCNGRGWTGSERNPSQCSNCKGEGQTYTTKKKYSNILSFYLNKPSTKKCDVCDGKGSYVTMEDEK